MEKIFIPGNHRLTELSDGCVKTLQNSHINMHIDYSYIIPEDGKLPTENGYISVKKGDIVLWMYTTKEHSRKAHILNDSKLVELLTEWKNSEKTIGSTVTDGVLSCNSFE